MGHANVDVTQNAYGRSWREELVEVVERTIDAVFPRKRLRASWWEELVGGGRSLAGSDRALVSDTAIR
jgi:hypothetical protein